MDRPIRVFLEKFALGVYHLRLDPDTEFHAGIFSGLHQMRNAVRQLIVCNLPIAQSGLIVLTRVFISEPTIVQQEHIYT